MIEKVISGGQTGVDRGALDAALAAGIPCGGWCPAGRKAEDGVIPIRYPLQEIAHPDYRQRTLRNVREADGTLILYSGELSGGSRLTAEFCEGEHKPVKLIDAAHITPAQAVQLLGAFVEREAIRVLNVAGPRESGWPGAHAYSCEVLQRLLSRGARDAEPCA